MAAIDTFRKWGDGLLSIASTMIDRRFETLAKRIEALEQQKVESMRYVGIWREGQHHKGDVATHGGQLWFAHTDTADKPGTSSSWQLMAKGAGR